MQCFPMATTGQSPSTTTSTPSSRVKQTPTGPPPNTQPTESTVYTEQTTSISQNPAIFLPIISILSTVIVVVNILNVGLAINLVYKYVRKRKQSYDTGETSTRPRVMRTMVVASTKNANKVVTSAASGAHIVSYSVKPTILSDDISAHV